MSRKLGCIGDVHGKYGPYRNLIKDKIGTIQVGDMGVGFRKWPHGEPQANPPYDKMVNGKHRFIRGNHDNPGVCKRHTQYIHDGVVEDGIMFCGGAVSIDKEFRIPDFSWWVDEELETAELYKIVDIYHANKPRIMITHECPESIAEAMLQHFNRTKMNFPSRTRQAFEVMRQINPPELWVFGHWHVSFDHVIDGTRYVCLNELEYKEFEID